VRDDPFMAPDSPAETDSVPSAVTFELSDKRGQVGFVNGMPWRLRCWLGERIRGAWLTPFERRRHRTGLRAPDLSMAALDPSS